MKDDISVSGDHERDFGAITVRNDAAHHCRRYIAVQERAQNPSAGRRVQFELAILYTLPGAHIILNSIDY